MGHYGPCASLGNNSSRRNPCAPRADKAVLGPGLASVLCDSHDFHVQAAASAVDSPAEGGEQNEYDAYDAETDPGTDDERQGVTAEPAGAWARLLQLCWLILAKLTA